MEAKSEDRRFKRTRLLLRRALVDLIVEKRYEKITVRHIIDRAGVGRSTFYAHFTDKDDLLLTGFEPALQVFGTLVKMEESGEFQIMPTAKYFKHAKENYYVLKALARGRVIDKIFENAQACWAKSFENKIRSSLSELRTRKSEIPLTVLSNCVASTFLTLLKWWLSNDMPYSPERMDQMFRQLVMPTIRAALGYEAGKQVSGVLVDNAV